MEGRQGEHDDDPVLGLAKPIGQGSQSESDLDALRELYVPASHNVHRLRPLTFENEPAAQGTHETAPVTGLLEPGSHSLHKLSPGESP